MTESHPSIRRAGRPRTFDDVDVFLAITRVLSTVGYEKLTFATVAEEVGCTTSALIRRYGGRDELIIAYLRWIVANVDISFVRYRQMYSSPIDVLRALLLLPVRHPAREEEEQPVINSGRFNSFFIAARSEAAFRPVIGEIAREFEARAELLLREAQAVGELAECDTKRVAHLLSIAHLGAITVWFDYEEGPLEAEVECALDLVLGSLLVEHT